MIVTVPAGNGPGDLLSVSVPGYGAARRTAATEWQGAWQPGQGRQRVDANHDWKEQQHGRADAHRRREAAEAFNRLSRELSGRRSKVRLGVKGESSM